MRQWKNCRNILCIRPDNMGDVMMSGPAFRALKETFQSKLTLLSSSMGAAIAPFMPEVDDVIECDLPWVKTHEAADAKKCLQLVQELNRHHFGAAVIFTVYSQNPLPSAMLAFLAEIPLRLAYCRENPYGLLTQWIPDEEPYCRIEHQVVRDLELVRSIGAETSHKKLALRFDDSILAGVLQKNGADTTKYIVVHPSVSEQKRKVPAEAWAAIIRELRKLTDLQIIITGTGDDGAEARQIIELTGVTGCKSVCGQTNLQEFIALISGSSLLLSVNTSATHIAAAVQTPVVVLYAMTNPQHTPWQVRQRVFYFQVPPELRSRNEVIRFVNENCTIPSPDYPDPLAVAEACVSLLETPRH